MISISIIGTGNVAYHLAKAFSEAKDINLQYIAGRSAEKLKDFEGFGSTTTHLKKTFESEVVLIAISDSIIQEIAEKLEDCNSLVVHTSGSTDLDALSNLKRSGVFYPLQTFSKNSTLNYNDIPFCIEAKLQEDLDLLNELAKTLKAKAKPINSSERAALHLAAVFSNNFCNHILTEAETLCKQNNVPFELLKSLMQETIHKAFSTGPENSQTGPAKRGDQITIEKQLASLKTAEQTKIYTTLTQAIRKHYERYEL